LASVAEFAPSGDAPGRDIGTTGFLRGPPRR
jgi:hypothetical protein